MSWVKYEKDAQKHEAARQVKRDLTKLIKKYEHTDNNFFIKLTGRESWDRDVLRSYESMTYRALVRDIQQSFKDNDEHGYDGFYTTRHAGMINFIQDINKIVHYMVNNYCLYEVFPNKEKITP